MKLLVPPTMLHAFKPLRLKMAVQESRRMLRKRGLLEGDDEAPAADLAEVAGDIVSRLRGRQRLDSRVARRLPSVLVWAHQRGRQSDLKVIEDAIAVGQVHMSVRLWVAAASLYWDDVRIRTSLRGALERFPDARRARLPGSPSASDFDKHPGGYPGRIASRLILEGATLNEVGSRCRVPPATPLFSAVWDLLLSDRAVAWTASHSQAQLTRFLASVTGTVLVGRLGAQLLGPLRDHGLTLQDVSKGQPLAALVSTIAEHMPPSRSHPAWVALGPKAGEVLRWWRVQREIEHFFELWDAADPRRLRFWHAYVEHISDVEPYSSANALAMRIRDRWFVEFGEVGNAAYSFDHDCWVRTQGDRRGTVGPGALKHLPCPHKDKRNHKMGWEVNFTQWVNGHTGAFLEYNSRGRR